ncbi:uncharacterized protein MYCFIDRAFT_146637 [Pseudocercospora fijiensis CIRAD86]|uniref:BTB domain-containing protein n=1 Tax=Pseudocercospora fijiensis (strain CIRAD86) TaxID=383855 RepID=M2ZE67_PSEFD|nr:uncharacterized protein MYCFIDRAFT_146637 [Pseudocercospora fijiensis CIRAD86]EME77419.1 hypothetical protein MYCFIDRAFT_146637 [Pseudocercospora fijiensis CIRAD86]
MIDDRIVTLRVGDTSNGSTRDFSIHEAILAEYSPYFRAALDEKWRECSRVMELPFDDIDIVAAYAHWLYFKRVASKLISPPKLSMDDGEFLMLARLYCFGEKVQDEAFCDGVITAMTLKTYDVAEDGTRIFPGHCAVMALYNGTTKNSISRKFMVDMYCEFGMDLWIPEEAELNHPEFLADLVRAFLGGRKSIVPHMQTNFPRRRTWHKRQQSRDGVSTGV